MGRPPKPTRLHVVDGTLNTTRHSSRGDSSKGGGAPQKTSDLSGYQLECWETLVEPAIRLGIAVGIDSLGVSEICRLYSYYRQSCDQANIDPTEKNARCAVIAYWTAFERVAAKYGLTPADRIKLVAPDEPESDDPADKHFRNSA